MDKEDAGEDQSVVLGLDEALLQLDRKQFDVQKPIELFYQVEECYGCPLKKLEAKRDGDKRGLSETFDEFIISTKHTLSNLELRGQTATTDNYKLLCKISAPFKAQNKAEYLISPGNNNNTDTTAQECTFTKLKEGPCDYCWFSLVFGVIFLLSLLEYVWIRYCGRGRKNGSRRRRLVYDSSHQTELKQVDISDPAVVVQESIDNKQEGKQGAHIGSQDQESQTQNTNGLINEHLNEDEGNNINSNDKAMDGAKNRERLDCLDTFRGMTITGMIMVNYGGAGYDILEHAPWDGLTLADLVFPFFIFSMGASIGISIKSMLRNHDKRFRSVVVKIFRRSIVLLLMGICLNSVVLSQSLSWKVLRLPGVLQRFAISYRVVAMCYALELYLGTWIRDKSRFWGQRVLRLTTGRILEIGLASLCTAVYLFFTFFFRYDQYCPVGYTGPGGSTEAGLYRNCTGGAAGWIDRKLLGETHLWRNREMEELFETKLRHDPEGILGYSTSILLTLVGLSCGLILMDSKLSSKKKLALMFKWLILMLALCSLIIWIPINKSLWSLTFIASSGACAIVCLTTLYILMDYCKCHKGLLLRLWQAAGKNSLLLYLGHSLIHKMLPFWFPIDETNHLALLLQLLWSTFVWLLFAKWLDNNKLYVTL